MKIEVKQMDQTGNGIGFIDNKIVFVNKAITGDIVDVTIDVTKKNYSKAHINKIIKPSNNRIDSLCPFFDKCGGCQLWNMNYDNSLEYKVDRIKNILKPLNIDIPFEVIPNQENKNYRNKIELKIVNSKIGFYENDSNNLIEIDNCLITKQAINNFFDELKQMNIKNGDVTIRCNYNDELLIVINSKDDVVIKEDYSKYKVVGIVLNDKTIYGEPFFMECINNYFFKVSYDAFFQVNNYINSKLFNIIEDNVKGKTVLDLYSGVGTLSIASSKTSDKVYGIEVIPNAVLNAMQNVKMNNINNVDFLLGKVEDKIHLIDDSIDTVIIDPPRKGLDFKTLTFILNKGYQNLIYISCEAQNLVKDLRELLKTYTIKKIYLLDMFSYTYHCEVVTILENKNYLKDKIKFEKITNDNLKLATKIQNEIFNGENGKENYIEFINKDPYRKEMDYEIVYVDDTPVGITGIYSYNEYPDDAWLGWFGILEKYRNKGYGKITLEKTMELAKSKGYKTFRLYTDEYAKDAHRLYEKVGMVKESYDRLDDKDEFFISDIYIYSKSLNDEKIELWNNKFIGLKEQGNKENLF